MAKAKVVHSTDGVNVLVEGDKFTRNEPSCNVISFPGGYIEVSRTSNDEYWAHIYVNRDGQVYNESHMQSKRGEIVDGRIDYIYPANPNVVEIENFETVNHIAVRIKTS